MKKVYICFIFLILLYCVPIRVTFAANVAYARVNNYGVYLYRTPTSNTDYDNLYFAIERSYFVQITASAGNNFYQAKYNGITGYVKKNEVRFVASTPQTPYVTGKTFRIYGDQSRSLRTQPTNVGGESSLIKYLPLYTTNLTYIASIEGDSVIAERTNVWYYCKYTGEEELYGYVYSDMCDQMSTILLNTETCEYTKEPDWLSQKDTSQPLTQKNTNIVIGILCVPVAVVFLMIIFGGKILSRTNETKLAKKETTDFNLNTLNKSKYDTN